MENNKFMNKLRWVYLTGFGIILALPILTLPPWFFPPDWGKTIIFRSIMAIMLFLFLAKNLAKSDFTKFKRNPIIWALGALFTTFLLATIFSVDPNFSLWGSPYRGGGFVTFAFYFAFVILASVFFSAKNWRKALDFSIFIGVLVSLLGIMQSQGIIFTTVGRPFATMGNSIILGIYLLLLSFIAVSFGIK
jgi:hypothetical protein